MKSFSFCSIIFGWYSINCLLLDQHLLNDKNLTKNIKPWNWIEYDHKLKNKTKKVVEN